VPSPIGHLLGGIAAAWTADLLPGDRGWRTAGRDASWYRRAGDGITLACAAIAVSPDLDLSLAGHRTVTHSVAAAAIVAIIAAGVTRWVTGGPVTRVALMCAGAYTSHLLFDWMAADTFFPYGIQLFWPLSGRWYISGWDVFLQTERYKILGAAAMAKNAAAVSRETLMLVPLVAALWLLRARALRKSKI
jgi:membrane-bound metal-dependent hydrolase YbcI (DUF457 family)